MRSQRQMIHDVLSASASHPTAEQIFLSIREQSGTIAMGTVYRNLNLMCEDGEIMKIPVPGQADHFDRNPAYHNHVICKQCGAVRDVLLTDLRPMFSAAAGSAILSYDLLLYEVCAACHAAHPDET